MRALRKTSAAWQLLQRMNQVEAGVIFNAENGRYHFIQHCRALDPVSQFAVEALMKCGYVKRERSAIPIYSITDKGRGALNSRDVPSELEENEVAL